VRTAFFPHFHVNFFGQICFIHFFDL